MSASCSTFVNDNDGNVKEFGNPTRLANYKIAYLYHSQPD